MKKLILLYSVAIGVILFMPSCKKSFLDETVYSSYSPSTLKDALGFDASLAALYRIYAYNFYTRSDRQGWLNVWQVGTDIAYAGQQEGVEVPYYNYTQLQSTDNAARMTWSGAYQIVNNANIIIKNIQDPDISGISEENKKAIEGEARFFRALAYNLLATCFGKVPLVSEPLTAPKTDFVRASLDEVNSQIEEDLLYAGTNLPNPGALGANTNSLGKPAGRAHKYMAMQLLAEAYLRMGKPDKAEQQALAVINSGYFSLNTTRYGVKASQPGDPFSDMFTYGNMRRSQGNKEALWVFEMEHPASVVGGVIDNPQQRRVWNAAYYQINGMKITDSLGGRGLARLRLNNFVIYDLYEDNDMRNSPYNFRRRFYYNNPTSPNLGQMVPYTGFDTVFRIPPHTTKYYQFDPKDEFGYAMIKDLMWMRLAETYLLLAEAQLKQSRPGDAAITLNILRNRANATPVMAAEVDMDYILDERVRELVGEENRRMTLMRTGMLVERATRLNAVSPVNQLTGIQEFHELMPIPQTEIDLNKDAVLEQNTGY